MASLSLYLRTTSKNPKDFATIYFNYQIYQGKFRGSTGIKIKPQNWDSKNQCAKQNSARYSEINDSIDDIITEFSKTERRAKLNNIPITVEYIKNAYLKDNSPNISVSFTDSFREYISESETTKASSTITSYKTTLKHLLSYQENRNIKLSHDQINFTFFEAFCKYLLKDLDLLNNTVGKIIKIVKSFMHYSVKKGFTNNIGFKNDLKVWKEDIDIVYLTREEFLKLFNYDLSENKRLEHIRDVFCFGITTGLRFSDILTLSQENISKDSLSIITQKTKTPIIIPLNKYSQTILQKYTGLISVLPTVSNQKTNEYLKELCELAGIDEPIQITQFQGSTRIVNTLPKFELVSTHTARRTFITLSLENGARPEVLMQITGHRSIKSFYKYIKITDKVKSIELNKAWAF